MQTRCKYCWDFVRQGMGWDGMGWDGMGWDGMGWDGMGWDGMGWDGMGWDGAGWGLGGCRHQPWGPALPLTLLRLLELLHLCRLLCWGSSRAFFLPQGLLGHGQGPLLHDTEWMYGYLQERCLGRFRVSRSCSCALKAPATEKPQGGYRRASPGLRGLRHNDRRLLVNDSRHQIPRSVLEGSGRRKGRRLGKAPSHQVLQSGLEGTAGVTPRKSSGSARNEWAVRHRSVPSCPVACSERCGAAASPPAPMSAARVTKGPGTPTVTVLHRVTKGPCTQCHLPWAAPSPPQVAQLGRNPLPQVSKIAGQELKQRSQP